MSDNEMAMSFKIELLELLRKIIPAVFETKETEAEISNFILTGVIPTTWWQMIFEKDISPDILTEMHDLMDSIHESLELQEELISGIENPTENIIIGAELEKPLQTGAPVVENKVAKVGRKKGGLPPKKPKGSSKKNVQLRLEQVAQSFFSSFIEATLSEDRKLNLIDLRHIVAKNLIDHTVSYDPQKQILTLYDNEKCPLASFDAIGIEIVLA